MPDWSVTHDPVQRVFRLCLPQYLSTAVARAALTDLVSRINGEAGPSILVADLRAVRRIDPQAPIVGARICSPAVPNIEHLYILTDNRMVRVAACAAASSIGLRFSCHEEEPDREGLRRVPSADQT